MTDKVLRFCQAQLPPGSTVYCALSGGCDSVALLHMLHSLRDRLHLEVRAAHFNHQLRGAESDRDEAFCRTLCETLQIPLTVGRGDTPAQIAGSDDSVEEAARRLRYAFFETLPGFVATAHTADDNLETVLINLTRGTSLAGLCGIPPVRGSLLRPMLNCTREEVCAYLSQHQLPHTEDASNQSDDYLRNRLRHQVVPLLKQENPSLLTGITAMTERLRRDDAFLNASVTAALTAARDGEAYHCAQLAALPDALLSRAASLLLSDMPDRSSGHIQALSHLIRFGGPSALIHLPGGRIARREYDLLFFDLPTATALPDTPLKIPGQTRLGNWLVETSLSEQPRRNCLCFSFSEKDSYSLRSRQSGDRLSLSGGSKSIKKLMIDRKIPLLRRDSIPVLCKQGKPIALLGIAAEQQPDAGAPYLIISYKELNH